MAYEDREPGAEAAELDLESGDDLDATMAEAVKAVEEVEREAQGNLAKTIDNTEALRSEISELRDRTMRTLADFDNYRKRSEREQRELRRYAVSETLREVVEVMDNLERALGASGGSVADLKAGVEMILRQMQDLLRRYGVRDVPSLGESFDPAVHEAVSRHEDPAVQAPTVTEELQRGYFLHDRLLRPAMVKVAMPVEPAPAGGATGAKE